ncbi:hypothetical protein MNBD_BACTEROID03-1711 [hydrothermal vent metagenome]|uniref:Uncharacterized protein n=1 Tax=hydrothermal vent metagenome TaxID=652676 RepID=A0A3B0TSS3_9ZZZZ
MLITSCSKDDNVVPTSKVGYLFEDGFETQDNDLMELFPCNGSRWTNIRQVSPNGGDNEIGIESNTVLSGNNSLRVYTKASDSALSKVE